MTSAPSAVESVPRLSPEALRPLYEPSLWRAGLHAAGVPLAIVLVIASAISLESGLSTALAVVLVGALQHHLSILNHEANHFLLFRSRVANEAVRALSAWSTGFRLDYRKVHARHHRSLGAADDPDLENYLHHPLSRRAFARDVAFHLSGLAALSQFVRQSRGRAAEASPGSMQSIVGEPQRSGWLGADLLGILLVQALIFAAIAHATGSAVGYVVYWLLPLATVAKSLTHFRNVVEHTRLADVGDAALSRHRTILCGRVEAFFFAPLHFNYHAEHHLYPSIPFHQLPRAHRALCELPGYTDAIQIERGFLRFLWRSGIRRSAGSRGFAPRAAS